MRVVIAEDEVLLRQGLGLLLTTAGCEIVGAVGDADELLATVAGTRPDVVVTDIRMPPGGTDDGLRAAIAIRDGHPGTGVIVLSQFVQRRYAIELLGERADGVGYLLKQRIVDAERFCDDVRRVGEGGTVLDHDVVDIMVNRAHRSGGSLDRLTGRQLEVLALMAQGRSNTAIAARLGVSEKAVVQHASNIYLTLGIAVSDDDHRRVLAVVRYLSELGSGHGARGG